MLYRINELKVGLKVIQNKEPCIIINNKSVKPGKGLSFNRVRFKKIVSGKIIERTLKSGEYLESADIVEIKLVYLYYKSKFWCFMNEENFEQIFIHADVMGDAVRWMTEQLVYTVTFWNKKPILVTPPDCMTLKIIDTVSGTKNSSVASSGNKLATLSTGIVIKVPVFIKIGEFIKVNTQLGVYVSRVKQL